MKINIEFQGRAVYLEEGESRYADNTPKLQTLLGKALSSLDIDADIKLEKGDEADS